MSAPPVLGAHIGAPLHGRGGKSPPYVFALPVGARFSRRLTTRQAQRPGRAESSRPTQTARHSSLRGGPQTRRGNPYFPFKENGFPRPLRGLGMTERRGQVPALRVCVARRGRCPHRPAGGHMGPPLRILTNGAGWTKTPHPSRPSAVLSSPEGESSARRVVAPYKRPPPLWGRCPSVRTGAEGGKRPVCRNDSIYGCPPQSRLTARQLPRKGGAKAGRTLCAPTHLGGDQKIINFQFSILNF